MSGQTIALATKGILCKSQIIRRIILPFNLNLENDIFDINLEEISDKDINLNLENQQKINVEVEKFSINKKLIDLKVINIEKVCD